MGLNYEDIKTTYPEDTDAADTSGGNTLGGGDIILVDIVGSSADGSHDPTVGLTDSQGGLEAPVPPGEIIIMPEPDCPPGTDAAFDSTADSLTRSENASEGADGSELAGGTATLGWGVGGIEADEDCFDFAASPDDAETQDIAVGQTDFYHREYYETQEIDGRPDDSSGVPDYTAGDETGLSDIVCWYNDNGNYVCAEVM